MPEQNTSPHGAAQPAYRRIQSERGWRSGCIRRDRTWERNRRIFDRYREGAAVEDIIAEGWCDVSRSQAYRIIARIRAARAEKAMLPEPERHRRRCARGAWLRTQREHESRVWRRLEYGAPYAAPAFPAELRRRYPARLGAKYRESHEPSRSPRTHARRPPSTAGSAGNGAVASAEPTRRQTVTAALVDRWRRQADCWQTAMETPR